VDRTKGLTGRITALGSLDEPPASGHYALVVDWLRRRWRQSEFASARLYVVLVLAIPMMIASALIGPTGGWHPTLWQRVGNVAAAGILSALVALRVFDSMND
jgi:hypothetical protein